MKRLLIVGTALSVVGCASTNDPSRQTLLSQFYGQQRTYQAVTLTGANDIHISGEAMTFQLDAPLAPLSVIPSDPNTALAVGTMAKDALLGGMGIYVAGKAIGKALETPRTVEPAIVRPEVIMPEAVPAGP